LRQKDLKDKVSYVARAKLELCEECYDIESTGRIKQLKNLKLESLY